MAQAANADPWIPYPGTTNAELHFVFAAGGVFGCCSQGSPGFQNRPTPCKTYPTEIVSLAPEVNGAINRHLAKRPIIGGVAHPCEFFDGKWVGIGHPKDCPKPLYCTQFRTNADGYAQTPGRQASGSAEDIAQATQHGRWQPRMEEQRGTDTGRGVLQRYRPYRHQDDAIRTIPISEKGWLRLPLLCFRLT